MAKINYDIDVVESIENVKELLVYNDDVTTPERMEEITLEIIRHMKKHVDLMAPAMGRPATNLEKASNLVGMGIAMGLAMAGYHEGGHA